ncbi:MAG: AtpZ/AtpI family protein [Nitrospirae bacterium]|nr:AtpZ/AtpI family protein [Nitrospirota bacterium]
MPEKKNQPPPKKEAKSDFFRLLGIASTVGINLVLCTFIGFAIGYYLLDKYLNTFPWFTIIFLILGIAAGFKYLLTVALKEKNNSGNS